MSESTITTVRMWPETILSVEQLKETMKAPSFSETLRRTIGISELLVNSIKKGGKIIIEDKKGKQKEIFIVGVNK